MTSRYNHGLIKVDEFIQRLQDKKQNFSMNVNDFEFSLSTQSFDIFYNLYLNHREEILSHPLNYALSALEVYHSIDKQVEFSDKIVCSPNKKTCSYTTGRYTSNLNEIKIILGDLNIDSTEIVNEIFEDIKELSLNNRQSPIKKNNFIIKSPNDPKEKDNLEKLFREDFLHEELDPEIFAKFSYPGTNLVNLTKFYQVLSQDIDNISYKLGFKQYTVLSNDKHILVEHVFMTTVSPGYDGTLAVNSYIEKDIFSQGNKSYKEKMNQKYKDRKFNIMDHVGMRNEGDVEKVLSQEDEEFKNFSLGISPELQPTRDVLGFNLKFSYGVNVFSYVLGGGFNSDDDLQFSKNDKYSYVVKVYSGKQSIDEESIFLNALKGLLPQINTLPKIEDSEVLKQKKLTMTDVFNSQEPKVEDPGLTEVTIGQSQAKLDYSEKTFEFNFYMDKYDYDKIKNLENNFYTLIEKLNSVHH